MTRGSHECARTRHARYRCSDENYATARVARRVCAVFQDIISRGHDVRYRRCCDARAPPRARAMIRFPSPMLMRADARACGVRTTRMQSRSLLRISRHYSAVPRAQKSAAPEFMPRAIARAMSALMMPSADAQDDVRAQMSARKGAAAHAHARCALRQQHDARAMLMFHERDALPRAAPLRFLRAADKDAA